MPTPPVLPADRRLDVRYEARVEVHFGRLEDAARALRAYSLNLSAGGLCLKTQREYEVGTRLALSLEVGGGMLHLSGVVAWVRGGAIGVRFIEVPERDRALLASLASSYKKSS